eukprot:TRINITY_DN31719_c0_g1_i1.p1 TRINITY_DN31719_c0_g1~~TRINITY_DN31719_c0_g1_i1.p1  ORF type:complete len:592 (+),score=48.62 TRINITY_DN31719_c0_g1_i1:54-1829(+)
MPQARPRAESDDVGVESVDLALTLVGYCVGFGNALDFPHLVGKNGGAAFVLVYVCCLVFVAFPVFYLELRWGQLTRKSTWQCYKSFHPRWEGVGWSSSIILLLTASYYSMSCAYCLIYMYGSIYDPLPWATQSFNTDVLELNGLKATQYYWDYKVLDRFSPEDEGRKGFGAMQGQLVVASLCTWILIFLLKRRGMTMAGKLHAAVVLAPFIITIILVLRVSALDGSGDGIDFYLNVDFSAVYDPSVWVAACFQILFSLSPGTGATVTIASFASPKTPIATIALLVTVVNSTFSMLFGLLIYSILGYIRHRKCFILNQGCQSVSELAESSGQELSFVIIAEGFEHILGSNIISLLFFSCLFCLGMTTLTAWAEANCTYLCDTAARLGMRKIQWSESALYVSMIGFFLTLPFCTRIGFPLRGSFGHYGGSYNAMIVCVAECLMHKMNGIPGVHPRISFMLLTITPVLLLGCITWQLFEDITDPIDMAPSLHIAGVACITVSLLPIVYSLVYRNWLPFEPPSSETSVSVGSCHDLQFVLREPSCDPSSSESDTQPDFNAIDYTAFNDLTDANGGQPDLDASLWTHINTLKARPR